MQEFTPNTILTSILYHNTPAATAQIRGNANHPDLFGTVSFYTTPLGGVLVSAEMYGMPASDFYGMHIHEFGNCTPVSGGTAQPFSNAGGHYNPTNMPHPEHAGDLIPLLSNHGYAWTAVYTDRFRLPDIIGRSVIVHGMRDDFTSQPAGDSGERIGCGVINKV